MIFILYIIQKIIKEIIIKKKKFDERLLLINCFKFFFIYIVQGRKEFIFFKYNKRYINSYIFFLCKILIQFVIIFFRFDDFDYEEINVDLELIVLM